MTDQAAEAALRFPSLVPGWADTCNAVLEHDQGGEALARALCKRWKSNNSAVKPDNLDPDPGGLLDKDWSELLGYALAQPGFGGAARVNLVAGFRKAAQAFEPNLLKGALWLGDCLALRHLRYDPDDEAVTLAAMDLMLEALSSIPGHVPLRDAANYARFHDIYQLASDVIVTEVREKRFVDAMYKAGSRLLPATHSTLFEHMVLNGDNGAAFTADENADMQGSNPVRNWRQAADRCADLSDALFATLMQCNPDFASEGRFAADALFSHARELDVAWFRLAHVCSDSSAALAVIKGLRDLRRGEDSVFAIDKSELKLGPQLSNVWLVWRREVENLGAKLLATFDPRIKEFSRAADHALEEAA